MAHSSDDVAGQTSLFSFIGGIWKLSQPRFHPFQMQAFATGVLVATQSHPLILVAGLVACFLLHSGGVVHNIFTDRVEDEINWPDRSRLVVRLRPDTLPRVVHVIAGLYLLTLVPLGAGLVRATGGGPAATMLFLWLALLPVSLQYSSGPRFKASTLLQPVSLASTWPICFGLGWLGTRSWASISFAQARSVGGALLLFFVFGVSLFGWKDAADVEGDTVVGYRSLYHSIERARHPLRRILSIVLIPYGFVLFVNAVQGSWNISALAPLIALPFGVCFARVMARATTVEDKLVLRELGNWYWLTAMPLVTLRLDPRALTLAIGAAGLCWHVACTLWAHPDPGLLNRDRMGNLWQLIIKRRRGVQSVEG